MGRSNLTDEDVVFLFNELRKSSIIWSGRKEALANARKKVFSHRAKNGNAQYKYHWQCAICGKWTPDEKKILEEDRKHKEETAKLRAEDYQLSYAIDILRGMSYLASENTGVKESAN